MVMQDSNAFIDMDVPIDPSRDGVVILHGILSSNLSMRWLERYLKARGFQTLNVSYPSTRHPIETLVEIILPQIDAFSKRVEGRVHFVGFSLGGLLTRAYLTASRPHCSMGRVVLIAPPNQGSPVADTFKDFRLYKTLFGPAGQQLITDQSGIQHLFGEVWYELGVIAGNRVIDPICHRIIGDMSDGKVPVKSTHMEGMKDHMVISANHTFFPYNRHAWRQASHFIKTGTFMRAEEASSPLSAAGQRPVQLQQTVVATASLSSRPAAQ